MIISDSDDDQELLSQDQPREQEDQDDEDNEHAGLVTGSDQTRCVRQGCTIYILYNVPFSL